MPVPTTLALRRLELERRVDALPEEVKRWRDRSKDTLDMNAHFSQLQAIEILLSALVAKQRQLLQGLDPTGNHESFRVAGLDVVREIIRSHGVWDFFRDKLELRFSPDFKDVLWVADTVAWDCYRPVMDRAVAQGILPAANVREPPLTYLTADFSPATWVRGSRPNDGRNYYLGTANLPIPVIELPWDHMGNMWELMSLHHEVAHDLEADLRLRPALLASLRSTLEAAGVPEERVKVWLAWEGETFADLVGLRLGGPVFARGLMHLLLLPTQMVVTYQADDPHPTHYVRILMNAAYIRTLVPGNETVKADADQLEATWKELYDPPPALTPFVADFPHVFTGLMGTSLPTLKGATVEDLTPFSAGDDARTRSAAAFLQTGMNAPAPQSIAPRLCISAARLAVMSAVDGPPAGVPDALDAINTRVIQLVRDNAAPGLRASDDSNSHKRFIQGFAEFL